MIICFLPRFVVWNLEDIGNLQIVAFIDNETFHRLDPIYFCDMLGDELKKIETIVEQDLQNEVVATGHDRRRQDSGQTAEILPFPGNIEIGELDTEIEKAVSFQGFGIDVAGEVKNAFFAEFVDP